MAGPIGDDRFDALVEFGRTAFPQYRFTWPFLGWWNDSGFNGYLERFGELEGLETHRRWELCQLLRLTVAVAGDTAECGVFRGAGSYLLAAANRALGSNRVHHGFDSFAGLSRPSDRDGTFWTAGELACGLNEARANLREFGDLVRLYPGWIPSQFGAVAGATFRFVHVDVDLYEPTRDSLRFFYPRVAPGGVITCDDYFHDNCPGATLAVDEFLANKPEKMLALSAGGGFLIKGVRTGARPP
jgi:hypothetical protein